MDSLSRRGGRVNHPAIKIAISSAFAVAIAPSRR